MATLGFSVELSAYLIKVPDGGRREHGVEVSLSFWTWSNDEN